ncbi:YceI family protein [Hellea balneolensis]|uniref:YceI family protein n=1 Tax=Hellea balneolensis TaxID=287478 RepID=UPI0004190248|nr:YceI family protein [Hellea balneolensis]
MKLSHLTTSILAGGLLMGCAQAENAAETVAAKTSEAAQKTTDKMKETVKDAAETAKAMKPSAPGVDISAAPSGTYTAESTHAYIAFSYSHQGYSNPILRWGKFDGTLELDSENPENSTLDISIPAASIDSGVPAFDEHLISADFFDAENHPTITFKSTDMDQIVTGTGRVTGDLTIKGVTKPITLDVKLNKVGKHFRSGKDMFGISATGNLKRSEHGVDKYAPMGDDVKLMIEVEFQKAD